MRTTLATLAALSVTLAFGMAEAHAGKGNRGRAQGPAQQYGDIVGLPPGHGGIPPGHGGIPPGQARKLYQPGYVGYPQAGYPGWGQQWIGVPGLDAGYDRWRRDAARAYQRGDFFIQGWRQRPYPIHGPYPYGWPR
ncbi:hypothetical protein [Tautonia plasticadhaerens]|uniref:Uncharacterized protein n=1 Tax=Tautonia plasticadhaerens TaxID=2527974 RepID=A0A518H3A9_9BACT|nr:hypothetical protein [Tautonia plasticadhaerens]QDV35308.1 hypothetical protein ElP_32110 [Tautonia plasticadhaerens]